MNINSIAGNNAYSFVQKAMSNAASSSGSTTETSGGGFADMVTDAVKGTMNNIKSAETVSANALIGKASLTDVVTAVNGADIALKSVVAIRDKVINAYQDIMKMPM